MNVEKGESDKSSPRSQVICDTTFSCMFVKKMQLKTCFVNDGRGKKKKKKVWLSAFNPSKAKCLQLDLPHSSYRCKPSEMADNLNLWNIFFHKLTD